MRRALLLFVCMGSLFGCEPSNPKGVTAPVTSSTEPPPTVVPPAAADGGATPAPAAAQKTLFVREVLADCEGEGPRKCMQVRESPNGDWALFYGGIEGFKYEEGHAYELRVSTSTVAHPPADGSSVRYRLVEIVTKQKVAPSGNKP